MNGNGKVWIAIISMFVLWSFSAGILWQKVHANEDELLYRRPIFEAIALMQADIREIRMDIAEIKRQVALEKRASIP